MSPDQTKTYLKINLCFSLISLFGFIFTFVDTGVRKNNDSDFYNILAVCLVVFAIGYLVNMIYSAIIYAKNKDYIKKNKVYNLTCWFSFFPVTNLFTSVTSIILLANKNY